MPPPLPKRLAAEVVGTFGFFFTGFCGIAAVSLFPNGILSLGIAAGFGMGLALMIFAFGHISGGHYNPAVTLGLAVARRFPTGEIVPYWAAQLVGGIAASVVLRIVFSQDDPAQRREHPRQRRLRRQGAGAGADLHVPLPARHRTVATDKRAPWNGVFAPFAIGLFIFTAATVCGPISGGSFNPARSITPALIDGNFSHCGSTSSARSPEARSAASSTGSSASRTRRRRIGPRRGRLVSAAAGLSRR